MGEITNDGQISSGYVQVYTGDGKAKTPAGRHRSWLSERTW